jgi:hypothetical protein
MYRFLCLKIEIKTKADSYMPCKAMAHSTKYGLNKRGSRDRRDLNQRPVRCCFTGSETEATEAL